MNDETTMMDLEQAGSETLPAENPDGQAPVEEEEVEVVESPDEVKLAKIQMLSGQKEDLEDGMAKANDAIGKWKMEVARLNGELDVILDQLQGLNETSDAHDIKQYQKSEAAAREGRVSMAAKVAELLSGSGNVSL